MGTPAISSSLVYSSFRRNEVAVNHMDSKLRDAARSGDDKYLLEQISTRRGDDLDYFFAKDPEEKGNNILIIATTKNHQEFVRTALENLPPQRLICQTAENDENALHAAARGGHLEITELLINAYNLSTQKAENKWVDEALPFPPPWRARNKRGHLPVHLAAEAGYEEVAKYLLLLEERTHFYDSLDINDTSSLFTCATRGRCKHIVQDILSTLDVPFSIAGFSWFDLQSLVTHWSEKDAILALSKKTIKPLVSLRTATTRKTILHLAIEENYVQLIEWWVANVDRRASCCEDKDLQNPLHIAAKRGLLDTTKLLAGQFTSAVMNNSGHGTQSPNGGSAGSVIINVDCDQQLDGGSAIGLPSLPWRHQDIEGNTPLHLAIKFKHRETALFILSLDMAYLCNVINKVNQSPLSLALDMNSHKIAGEILSSDIKHIGAGFHPRTFLQLARKFSGPVIHKGTVTNYERIKYYKFDGTDFEFWKMQIEAYLYKKDLHGPLEKKPKGMDDATWERLDQKALSLIQLTLTQNVMFNIRNEKTATGAMEALSNLYEKPSGTKKGNRGNFLWLKLVEQHPEFVRSTDATRKTILDIALEENDIDAMRFILKDVPLSTIKSLDEENGREPLLIKACRRGNMQAIRAICEIHPEAAPHLCDLDKSTALHNVKLNTPEEYRELLSISAIAKLKNETDSLNRTPLMVAINDNDLHLTEALLTMKDTDVVKNRSKEEGRMKGRTAAQMLKYKSEESKDWEKPYIEAVNAVTRVRTYFRGSFSELRDTLAVVAALLATITFAAAFTVPGGFNQDNGQVIFGRKASFIAFILSDAYAMCSSILVLFLLIWATLQESGLGLVLINKSISLLYQSLYGTLVAFMTGVYTILSTKSMWVASIVLVMSSGVLISTFIVLRFKLIDVYFEKRVLSSKES